MGKCLIINGADFSTNAIENIRTYLYPYEVGDSSSNKCNGSISNIFGFNTTPYQGENINFVKISSGEAFVTGMTVYVKITSTINSDNTVDTITVLASHTITSDEVSDGFFTINFNTITLPYNCLIGVTGNNDDEHPTLYPLRYSSTDYNLPVFGFYSFATQKVNPMPAFKIFDMAFGYNY